MKINNNNFLYCSILLATSLIICLRYDNIWDLILVSITVFLMGFKLGYHNKFQSLYIYYLVIAAYLPVNIKVSRKMILSYGRLQGVGGFVWTIMAMILVCMLLYSIEEIVFALVARLIWKTQLTEEL